LAQEYCEKLPITILPIGENGISKHIYLGIRENDAGIEYLKAFANFARNYQHLDEVVSN